MDILQKALAYACTQIGVMEEPLGSNRGKMVDAYQRSIGLNPADKNPWCMAFVYWVFEQAAAELGVVNPAIRSAQCVNVWHRASNMAAPKQTTDERAKANWKLVKPGMIFIMELNPLTHAGHTGFVESVNYNTGIMTTIEGNSNELGSREGLGVYRLKRRKINSINVGFIDYSEVVSLTPQSIPV